LVARVKSIFAVSLVDSADRIISFELFLIFSFGSVITVIKAPGLSRPAGSFLFGDPGNGSRK
jgi:hypothetical protein